MMNKKFSRKSDRENLKDIPVIKTLLYEMKENIFEIKTKISTYNGMKTDVDWLKKIWDKLTVGCILIFVAVVGIIVKLAVD